MIYHSNISMDLVDTQSLSDWLDPHWQGLFSGEIVRGFQIFFWRKSH